MHRLTVVSQIYHQSDTDEPIGIDSRFVLLLKSDEQAFVRRMKASTDWKDIDFGWLNDIPVSLISIENTSGKKLQTNPTEDEKRDIARRVIALGIMNTEGDVEAFALIRPGEHCSFAPTTRTYFIQTLDPCPADLTLTVIPA